MLSAFTKAMWNLLVIILLWSGPPDVFGLEASKAMPINIERQTAGGFAEKNKTKQKQQQQL